MSPLCLPYVSPMSPLCLPYVSPMSPLCPQDQLFEVFDSRNIVSKKYLHYVRLLSSPSSKELPTIGSFGRFKM